NYMRKEARFVGYKEAKLNFYRQLLTGDATDDIPGCKMVGKVKAEKLLPEWMPEEKMYNVVLDAYKDNIQKYPSHHGPFGAFIGNKDGLPEADFGYKYGAQFSLVENARLLHMLTEEDELWQPPGVSNSSIKGFLKIPSPEEFEEIL
ncbi:hypothetical protein LCGC14_2956970, partial [marine sediment metagenome]